MSKSELSPETVTETVIKDGYCRLEGFFDEDTVAALRCEGETIRDRFGEIYRETEPIKIMGGWRLGIPPANLVKQGGASLAPTVGWVVSHPLVQQVTEAIQGPKWQVTALVFDYREPTDEPLPPPVYKPGYPPAYFWHSDYGGPAVKDPEGFTLRFQVYLNDTRLANGSFAYAKGSHRLVKYLRACQDPDGGDSSILDTYDSVIAAANRLRESDRGLPPEYEEMLGQLTEAVPSMEHSDEATAVPGPPGTLLVFDDSGLHRVNFITTKHRYICRIQCNPIKLKEEFSSLSRAQYFGARQFFRRTLKEPFVSLM